MMGMFRTLGSLALAAGLFYSGRIYERLQEPPRQEISIESKVDALIRDYVQNPDRVERAFAQYSGD